MRNQPVNGDLVLEFLPTGKKISPETLWAENCTKSTKKFVWGNKKVSELSEALTRQGMDAVRIVGEYCDFIRNRDSRNKVMNTVKTSYNNGKGTGFFECYLVYEKMKS